MGCEIYYEGVKKMSSNKKFWGRVAPASKSQVNAKARELEEKIVNLESDMLKNENKYLSLINQQSERLNTLLDQQREILSKLDENKRQSNEIQNQTVNIYRSSNETIWSSIFHDTIKNSEWLLNKTFSPGRWAAGYPLLYVLYRCLDESWPGDILELGLGQTTRMIGQYAKANPNCRHYIAEHDEEWIEFFEKKNQLAKNSKIIKMDLIKGQYLEDSEVLMYQDFEEEFKDKKFDLISIDAPFGGAANIYARMDLLKLIPGCLKKSFIILLDDFNRKGEKNMTKKLEEILKGHNIEYSTGIYRGSKDTYILVSKDLKFFRSM